MEDASEPAKKAKKTTKQKHDKGKQALAVSKFFSQDQGENIKVENPDAGPGEIGKVLGAKWSQLSREEKEEFLEAANHQGKEDYLELIKAANRRDEDRDKGSGG